MSSSVWRVFLISAVKVKMCRFHILQGRTGAVVLNPFDSKKGIWLMEFFSYLWALATELNNDDPTAGSFFFNSQSVTPIRPGKSHTKSREIPH